MLFVFIRIASITERHYGDAKSGDCPHSASPAGRGHRWHRFSKVEKASMK